MLQISMCFTKIMHIKRLLFISIVIFVALGCFTNARKKKIRHFKKTTLSNLAPSNRLFPRFKRAASRNCNQAKACRCRSKKTLICSKADCLKHLPTRSMSKRRGEHIETILVTR